MRRASPGPAGTQGVGALVHALARGDARADRVVQQGHERRVGEHTAEVGEHPCAGGHGNALHEHDVAVTQDRGPMHVHPMEHRHGLAKHADLGQGAGLVADAMQRGGGLV